MYYSRWPLKSQQFGMFQDAINFWQLKGRPYFSFESDGLKAKGEIFNNSEPSPTSPKSADNLWSYLPDNVCYAEVMNVSAVATQRN